MWVLCKAVSTLLLILLQPLDTDFKGRGKNKKKNQTNEKTKNKKNHQPKLN